MLKHPTFWLIFSTTTLVVGIVIILVIRPVWGTDFMGGTLMEFESDQNTAIPAQTFLQDRFQLSSTAQTTLDGTLIMRMPSIDEDMHQRILAALLEEGLLKGEERRFESIGPTIGYELRVKSVWAISIALVVMIIYLAYEFRGMKGIVSPWKFGIAAIWALVHDLIFVTAAFVLFGKFWNAPVDTLFVTAQLAILGYSVNDTIVIFNRVQKEWITSRATPLITIIDTAMKNTLGRSLNTSLGTLLTLIALLILGGSTIRWFIVALILGIITGTYSSFFVAPPLLHHLTKHR